MAVSALIKLSALLLAASAFGYFAWLFVEFASPFVDLSHPPPSYP